MKFFLAMSVMLAAFAGTGTPIPDGGAEKMQTPWKTPPRRLNLESYIGTMYYHATKSPDKFRLEKRGESPTGLPVYLAVMTNRKVPDENKKVILLTAFHSGAERTATAGLLAFTEWLMGGDELAEESLRKNIVLMMPVCNPDGFFLRESNMNSKNFDPYAASRGNRIDLNTLQPKEPSIAPEHLAYQSVADEYLPDFHLDVHGTGLHFNAYIQPMSLGRAGSCSSLGPWDQKLRAGMAAAGVKTGFGVMDIPVASQRLIWGPAMGRKQESFCDMGQPYYFCAMYGYFRHHTMPCLLESTWNFSVTEPLKELLRLANRGFSTGPIRDFAVNTIKTNFMTFLESYGKTAADRRKNRVALWQKQHYFAVGTSYPNSANYMVAAVAYGKEGLQALTGKMADSGRWGQVSFADLKKSAERLSYIDSADLNRFLSFAPSSVNRIMFEKGLPDKNLPEPELKEGIAIRLQLPTAENDILELKCNGRKLTESALDGYQIWSEDGFTNIRVNIPPERTAKEKLFLVTCAWNPQKDIASQYGYLPNKEIQNWIRTSLKKSSGSADIEKATQIYDAFRKNGGKYR